MAKYDVGEQEAVGRMANLAQASGKSVPDVARALVIAARAQRP